MRWGDSFQFHLFTTNKCNLKCVYCALPDKGKQMPDYSVEELATILEKAPAKQKQLVFAFMEPTMNIPFIESVLEKTTSIEGLEYVIQTNGTRLHKLPLNVINQFSLLFVSVDGDAYVHNQQRGKNFDDIIKNVMGIKGTFPGKTEAAITVTPKVNIYTSVLGLMNIFDSVTWQLVEDDEPVSKEFMDSYKKQFTQLVEYWHKSFQGGKLYDFVPITGFTDIIANNKPYPYSNCGIGRNISVISYDGTAYSCPVAMKKVNNGEASADDHILGSVSEGITPKLFDLETKCFDKDCTAEELCRGRCNWYHLDNPSGFEKYCDTTRFMVSKLRNLASKLTVDEKQKLNALTATIVHDYTNIMP